MEREEKGMKTRAGKERIIGWKNEEGGEEMSRYGRKELKT